jgi:kynurenine formamidase
VTSDNELDALLPQLSNWGRWGAADQLGTLNYITEETIRGAHALVTEGRTVSLARAVRLRGNEGIRRAQYEMIKDESGSRDFLGGVWHGFAQTHLDALCHAFADPNRMYNGIATAEITEAGCGKLDIGVIAERGIVGRGVLLDVGALHGGALEPGTAIMVADLEEAARRQGVAIRSGDLLLVRTGAGTRNTRERRAGLHPECLSWVREKQIALLVGDGDSDVAPLPAFPRWGSPFHAIAIPHLGMPLVDNADLDPVARICAERKRWDFLLVIAPWRMTGATSSPVNPLAIF